MGAFPAVILISVETQGASMKSAGVLLVLLGIAFFVLPLLNVQPALLMQLGDFRSLAAVILILIGVGVFLFSGND